MSDITIDRAAAPRPTPKPGILAIAPYVPGKAKIEGVEHPLKLSANENILGSSSKAREAFASAIDQLHMYPDGRTTILRDALCETYGLEPERLVFGCGSDEIFQLLNQTFLEPGDNIVQGEFGFGAYAIGARACQAEVRMAHEPDYRIDVDEILKHVDARTRLVFIANPANPTGTWIPGSEIRRLHAALPPSVVLVLDGAYAEFARDPAFEDGMSMVREFENVAVTRTFSKLHGLAALRVGWAYMPPEMAAALDRIRLPFNVNIPAQLAAVAATVPADFCASGSLSPTLIIGHLGDCRGGRRSGKDGVILVQGEHGLHSPLRRHDRDAELVRFVLTQQYRARHQMHFGAPFAECRLRFTEAHQSPPDVGIDATVGCLLNLVGDAGSHVIAVPSTGPAREVVVPQRPQILHRHCGECRQLGGH